MHVVLSMMRANMKGSMERLAENYGKGFDIKGLVHPKMIISFTHPQGNLGVYEFLLSDESNRSNIQNCPGYSKLYHCIQRDFSVAQSKTRQIKCANP